MKAFTPQARRQWYDPVEAVVPLMESVLNISGAYEGAGAQEDGLYTADASQLRRFYELRHEKVLASVEFRQQNGSLNEAQADALLKREAQLQTPFAYGYTKGFSERWRGPRCARRCVRPARCMPRALPPLQQPSLPSAARTVGMPPCRSRLRGRCTLSIP